MAYLAIIDAVHARLAGADPKTVPHASALDARTEAPTPQASAPARYKAALTALVGKVRVPIYDPDAKAKLTNLVYPSLCFNIIDLQPRYEDAVYYSETYEGDGYEAPVAGSEEDVFDLDGSFIDRQPRLLNTRPIETPVDVLFEVRAYAAESTMRAMLTDYVFGVLPFRSFLRVAMKDGTSRSWDLLLQNAKHMDATQIPYESLGAEREFVNVWTYKVEAYLDNTDRAQLEQCVRQRFVNVEQA